MRKISVHYFYLKENIFCTSQPKPCWWMLYVGTFMLLFVYYLNYGQGSLDGVSDTSNSLPLFIKLLSVFLIVYSFRPFHMAFNASVLLLGGLYLYSISSMFLAIATYGQNGDLLFANTIMQLPILFALTSTQCTLDFGRWLRFIGVCLAAQLFLDVGLWFAGLSLWSSGAFVGGFGNPSSFGLFCTIFFAFYLMHPAAGKNRFFMAIVMAVAAVMSKSLFAVLSLAIVSALWLVQEWRRMIIGGIAIGLTFFVALSIHTEDHSFRFVEHKLNALGALLGLVEYDIDSSASVSVRLQNHKDTINGLVDQPMALLIGHIDDTSYWPIDSQLLTYIGSFGAIMLAIFLALHVGWLGKAFQLRRNDGSFTFIALVLFSLVFATNRILDYFPVATLYFACIAMISTAANRKVNEATSTL